MKYLASSLSGVILVGLMACQPTRVLFELPKEQSCTVPQDLKSHLTQNQSIHACLVVLWSGQPASLRAFYPILLQAGGNFVILKEDGTESPDGDVELPPASKGKSLIFRVYVRKPTPEPPNFASHQTLCNTMGERDFYCFTPDGSCWLSIQFQPTSSLSSQPVHPGTTENCRICQREVCDGKDNNCNGKIDEFDELMNKPCP